MATAPAARLDGQAWAEVTVDGATHAQGPNPKPDPDCDPNPDPDLAPDAHPALNPDCLALALPLPRRDAAGDDGDALITNY